MTEATSTCLKLLDLNRDVITIASTTLNRLASQREVKVEALLNLIHSL